MVESPTFIIGALFSEFTYHDKNLLQGYEC